MHDRADCSTIIVSYNTYELTLEAVRTALAAADDLRHQVIVVDNASPDRSGERLASAFSNDPRVTLITNHRNSGFSAANNQGAAISTGDVLFFLNPDTVVHAHTIARLVSFVRSHPEAGAVGPTILNADGSLQPSVLEFPTARWIIHYHLPVKSLMTGSDRRIDRTPHATEPVDAVKGCALCIRRSAFEEVGGWDESYFMYSEETELCRALVQSGYVNYFFAPASVTHLGGAASAERYAHEQVRIAESATSYIRRHHPGPHLLLFRASGLLGYAARVVAFSILMRRRPQQREAYRLRRDAARKLTRWFASQLFAWRQTRR